MDMERIAHEVTFSNLHKSPDAWLAIFLSHEKDISLRECFKSGRVRLENDQIQPNLLDRSQVYRIATDFGVLSNLPTGSSTQMGKMAGDQCDSVRQSYRLPMADVARQFSSMANGVFLLLELATRRCVAADQ